MPHRRPLTVAGAPCLHRRRSRLQLQVSKDLLVHRPLQDGGDDLKLDLKPPAVRKCNWPRAGACPINLIASLQSARLCLQRPLWSRQIEKIQRAISAHLR